MNVLSNILLHLFNEYILSTYTKGNSLHTEYRYKQVGFYTWLANIQAKENNIEEWVNE